MTPQNADFALFGTLFSVIDVMCVNILIISLPSPNNQNVLKEDLKLETDKQTKKCY